MAGKRCPSCGAAYNGRKCKNCLYVPFTEEISHGLHTHEGEPLVIKEPARRPQPRKNPLACDKKTRKKPRWLKSIVVWILVLNLLPIGIEWIQDGIDRAREPEPDVSRSALKLWEGEEITIWTDRQGSDPLAIPILVENNSREDIYVSSVEIHLGDYPASESFLFAEAEKREWGGGYLYLDEEEVKAAGSAGDILFRLEIYDADSYDTIATTDIIAISLE